MLKETSVRWNSLQCNLVQRVRTTARIQDYDFMFSASVFISFTCLFVGFRLSFDVLIFWLDVVLLFIVVRLFNVVFVCL